MAFDGTRKESCLEGKSSCTSADLNPLFLPNMAATPCQLHCKPDGKFFSLMLKESVTDGTPCSPGARDVCINGKCRVTRVLSNLRVGDVERWGDDSRCRFGLCRGCPATGASRRVLKRTAAESVTETVLAASQCARSSPRRKASVHVSLVPALTLGLSSKGRFRGSKRTKRRGLRSAM